MRMLFLLLATSCHSSSSCPSKKAPRNQVDMLFVLDNSPGTTPKVGELKARFPAFMQALEGMPLSYHFGVVTTDLGAGSAMNSVCAAGGDGGRLQTIGAGHGAGCVAPTGGLHFIDYNQIDGTNNLPADTTLANQFSCMASVGGGGCGFEHVLESFYRALHDDIPENRGFLRSDAILVVIFVTDEDDCSAPPDTDVFERDTSRYGAFASYRCSHWGVACGGKLLPDADSDGPLAKCVGAPNPTGNSQGLPPDGEGKLFDVKRYIDFFKSVKADPNDVIVGTIDAPSDPVVVIQGNPANYAPCAPIGPNCQVLLGHSCNASTDFFGDPAVRINQVVSNVMNGRISSICAQDYTAGLNDLADAITTQVKGGSSGNPNATCP